MEQDSPTPERQVIISELLVELFEMKTGEWMNYVANGGNRYDWEQLQFGKTRDEVLDEVADALRGLDER